MAEPAMVVPWRWKTGGSKLSAAAPEPLGVRDSVIPCPGLVLGWLCLLALAGCSTVHSRRIDRGRAAYFRGDFSTAIDDLTKVAESRSALAPTSRLDLAVAQFAAGDPHGASITLRKCRDEFDKAASITLHRDAAAMLTDDNQRAFRPAGYEEVMVRSMLSLCSLANGDGDAESYAMQAQLKQTELAQLAQSRGVAPTTQAYQPLALAPYLRGVLRESTHHDYDDAARAYELVSHLQPAFQPAKADIQRVGSGVHSAPGHGVLYVIACVGRGPQLVPTQAEATTAALQIATQVYSLAEEQRLALPNLASVQVPKVHVPHSVVAAVSIDSSGVWLGATQPLVDIAQMAIQQNEAEMPWTIARAVARRVTKEVTVGQTTRMMGINGIGRDLAHWAVVSAWSATEHADTRCWGLLSREIQVLRAELPQGTHRIGFTSIGASGTPVGKTSIAEVQLSDANNTYVTVFAPDRDVHVTSGRH